MADSRRSPRDVPYLRAVRFPSEAVAGQVYVAVQDAIFTGPPNDLSAYRFHQRQGVWYVAVLGKEPPPELDERIRAILATGEPVTLAPDVVATLTARRAQAHTLGSRVEGHYRPGQPF